MEKTLLIILVNKRREAVIEMQKILTEYGCIIKTRLGIHDGTLNECSNNGLIILELVGDDDKKKQLQNELQKFDDIAVKLVSLSL